MNKDALVTDNMKLVYSIAHSFRNRRLFDDLVGVGMLALVRASQSYDTNDGAAFSTFATRCIRNAMYDMMRRNQSHSKRINKLYTRTTSGDFEDSGEPTCDDTIRAMHDALATVGFDERTMTIIKHRFGIDTDRLTLEETSRVVKLSPARVQQIETQALVELRQHIQQTI